MTAQPEPLLEMCDLCQTLQPSSAMVDLSLRARHGQAIPVRFCRRCASPRLTYIAGHIQLTRVDVPRVLGFAFGLTIAILNIVLGRLAGGSLGLFIALAGILAGAGITVAFAISIALPHHGNEPIHSITQLSD